MFNIFGKKTQEKEKESLVIKQVIPEFNLDDCITELVKKHISSENLESLTRSLTEKDTVMQYIYVANKKYIFEVTRNHNCTRFYMFIIEDTLGVFSLNKAEKCKFIVDNFSQIESCLDDLDKYLTTRRQDKLREEQYQKKCAQRLAELVFQTKTYK